MVSECQTRSLRYIVMICMWCIILFTVLCGITYDDGMSKKYGGLRKSTIYRGNITNYIICESENDFDKFQPVVTIERHDTLTSCILWTNYNDDKCKSLNQIQFDYPCGSSVDVYLNINKNNYCVTENYLETAAYTGFVFLTVDMTFLFLLIVSICYVCYLRRGRDLQNNQNSIKVEQMLPEQTLNIIT